MTVRELSENLGCEVLALPDPDREVLGGYVGDLLSWVMGRAHASDAWITIMTNRNILAVATLADVACVIVAENALPDEGVADLAAEKKINLLRSPHTAFDLCRALCDLL